MLPKDILRMLEPASMENLKFRYFNGQLEQSDIDEYNNLFGDEYEQISREWLAQNSRLSDIKGIFERGGLDMDFDDLPMFEGNPKVRYISVPSKEKLNKQELVTTADDYVFRLDRDPARYIQNVFLTRQEAIQINTLLGWPYWIYPRIYAERSRYKPIEDKKGLALFAKIWRIYQKTNQIKQALQDYEREKNHG